MFGCEDAGRNVSDEGGGVLAPKFQGITGDLSRIGPRTRTSILRGHSSYYYHQDLPGVFHCMYDVGSFLIYSLMDADFRPGTVSALFRFIPFTIWYGNSLSCAT